MVDSSPEPGIRAARGAAVDDPRWIVLLEDLEQLGAAVRLELPAVSLPVDREGRRTTPPSTKAALRVFGAQM
jgi:hypothetical protein